MALLLIIVFYVGIGLLAAGGSIAITSKRFSARTEQIFYGVVLVPIAAIYLAFAAHYDATGAWQRESLMAALFAVAGLAGTRLLPLLILGYAAHGAWDLVHELSLPQSLASSGSATLTPIPLAYGAFCAAYDWCMVGYFYSRRLAWKTAWRAQR